MLQKSLYLVNVCLLLQSTSLVLWVRIFPNDNTSLEQIGNCILVPRYRYIGSFPSDFVPTLPNETFAVINTQPSNMPGEHWIMTTMFHHALYLADSFGLSIKNYLFIEQKCRQMIPARLQGHPSVSGFDRIHNLCSISSVQVSTGGNNRRY